MESQIFGFSVLVVELCYADTELESLNTAFVVVVGLLGQSVAFDIVLHFEPYVAILLPFDTIL